jgi:hypothetical protein
MMRLRAKAAMGWGKLRRIFTIAFRREQVLEMLDRRRGACSRCGACCKLMFQCPAYEEKDGNPRCLVYNDRPGVCGLFPLDERDLRERDFVMPHKSCGFWFEDLKPGEEPRRFREAMPVRWGPSRHRADDGSKRFLTGIRAILWTLLQKPPAFEGPSQELIAARKELDARGATAVTVSGGCMEPTFKDGQLVLAHRARKARTGDVVLLEAGGILELHRLLGRIDGGRVTWYVHKGDGSPKVGLVRENQILGVVDARPRPTPSPKTYMALMAFRLGALLFRLGLDPR